MLDNGIDKERSVSRIKPKITMLELVIRGICLKLLITVLGHTTHLLSKPVLMPQKSLCDCFTFDITKAEAYVMHQGHSATDEWIFDLGWWLGTDP